jgi:N-acetylmuramoyl-L-alanine amidase
VTRGQVAKIVANSAGYNDPPAGQTFQDVPPSHTFYTWVERVAVRGIIGGYPCGGVGEPCSPPNNRPYFRPNNIMTRGQLAKVVSNAAGYNEPPTTHTFQDVPPGSPFYMWVERVATRGIIGGYPCGGVGEPCMPGNRPYFRPNNPVTRGQTSKIVSNAFFPSCGP